MLEYSISLASVAFFALARRGAGATAIAAGAVGTARNASRPSATLI